MTNKTNKEQTRKKITLTISPKVVEKYKTYCDENGMNVSKRIELLMKNDLKRMKNENPNNR